MFEKILLIFLILAPRQPKQRITAARLEEVSADKAFLGYS